VYVTKLENVATANALQLEAARATPALNQTLYQIWTQSSNARRSYCDFNVWLFMTLNSALRVALGSVIILTKFDLW